MTAVQSHYSMLYEVVLHVDKCRSDGEIGANDTGNLKGKLEQIQNRTYDIICSMKIALRGEGAYLEHTVTQGVLSVDFLRLNWNSLIETYRVYILMNDIIGIMDYLKPVYTFFADTQTS